MRLSAPAKINLFLEVCAKRSDGYHELNTLMAPLSLCDILELEFTAGAIQIRCDHPDVPADETNLAFMAAECFYARLGRRRHLPPRRPHINLTKQIPVAAGLGGGSSDAAAVLNGLNRHFGKPFTYRELADIGLALGADVPFFIEPRPALAGGIGEVLTPYRIRLPYACVLVFPGFTVSTRWMAQGRTVRPSLFWLYRLDEQGSYRITTVAANDGLANQF